jgi:hypothetical protein
MITLERFLALLRATRRLSDRCHSTRLKAVLQLLPECRCPPASIRALIVEVNVAEHW